MDWKPFQKSKEKNEPPADNKDDQTALLDAFAARMDEKLQPLRDTVTALQGEWASIKSEAEKAAEPPPTELSDEQKRQNQDRANFLFNMQTRAMLVEQNLLNALSSDWSYLKPRLVEMFSKTAPE